MLANMSRYDIEILISKFFQEQRAMPVTPLPQPPASISVDVQPIADAILQGLTALASAQEYKAQLEDARERDLNKREDDDPTSHYFRNAKG
jgi:hypothetical protein